MVTVTDTAPIAGQNDEREQKSMNRETYETYSAAEPEKIDLIAFLAEYFQAFQKFFFGVLALVILAGGGSFLTAKLRYQPVYKRHHQLHIRCARQCADQADCQPCKGRQVHHLRLCNCPAYAFNLVHASQVWD